MVAADVLPRGGRVRREARALARAGHRVTVYGVLADGAEPEEDEGGVVLVRAPLARFVRPRAGFGGGGSSLFERCEPVVRMAMTRDPPEAVHAFGIDVALPAARAARGAGLPFVLDDGGDASDGPPGADEAADAGPPTRLRDAVRRLRRRSADVERGVRLRATANVVSSDALADDVVFRFGCERPLVVRDCPPFRRFSAGADGLRRRIGGHPADRIVAFHGPTDDAHGVAVAIRALRVLGDRVLLVVLGAAWCQDRILRIAADEGVLAQVRVVSTPTPAETLELLASAEVAAMPLSPADRRTRLGLPSSLLECLMAGVPVVVSDVPEAGALVRSSGAGVVVPAVREVRPNDVAHGLEALLSDPERRIECAAAATRAVRERLHWEKESERVVDLYDRVSSSL